MSSERVFDGKVASVRVDEVVMPGGGTAKREVVEHGGAVAVVALDRPDRSTGPPVSRWSTPQNPPTWSC